MQVGQLNKRIQVMKRTLVDNGLGKKETFVPYKTIWANAYHVSDGERMRAGMAQRNLTIRFTIRNTANIQITTADRISYKGQVFGIDGIKPIEKETFLEISAGLIK